MVIFIIWNPITFPNIIYFMTENCNKSGHIKGVYGVPGGNIVSKVVFRGANKLPLPRDYKINVKPIVFQPHLGTIPGLQDVRPGYSEPYELGGANFIIVRA